MVFRTSLPVLSKVWGGPGEETCSPRALFWCFTSKLRQPSHPDRWTGNAVS